MGDSARFVLKGIEGMLQTEVKFFSMVRRDGERMCARPPCSCHPAAPLALTLLWLSPVPALRARRYICLGKRALFLLDFEPPFQEQFYYAWITQVIIDSDNLLLFQVDFSEGRPSLILESFERERLCEELAICWKADFMFRKWTWQTFALKRGLCDVVKRERTASEFTTPPDKMQKMENKGYFMFADDAFRADPPGPDGQPTGSYRLTGRDTELKFQVEPPAAGPPTPCIETRRPLSMPRPPLPGRAAAARLCAGATGEGPAAAGSGARGAVDVCRRRDDGAALGAVPQADEPDGRPRLVGVLDGTLAHAAARHRRHRDATQVHPTRGRPVPGHLHRAD